MNKIAHPIQKRLSLMLAIAGVSLRNWSIVKILLIYQIPQLIIGQKKWLSVLSILLWPREYQKAKTLTLDQRITTACERMGPVFVKFGQLISTRVDILPHHIATALEKLQDDMPPFPFHAAKNIIETSLDQRLNSAFKTFDKIPIGSASLAQVHRATLHNGRSVVVKILRPHIEMKIEKNLNALYRLAKLIDVYHPNGSIIDATGVVADYDLSIHNEIDLLIEAANCSQMYRNAMHQSTIRIPKVIWKYCRSDLLVTEFLPGIKIQEKDQALSEKVDKSQIALNILMLFLDQAFKYNFFHADMHPGNILIDIKDPKKPVVSLVDFGIVGSMTSSDQIYIAQNLLAFFNRDYERIIQLHIESGWIPPLKNRQNMMNQIRAIGEPLYAKPLKEISFAKVLADLIQIARQYHMIIQPQLLLLQKTVFNIEAMARRIDPELNLWENAKPYVEAWIKSRYSIQDSLTEITQKIPKVLHDIANQAPKSEEVLPSAHIQSSTTTSQLSFLNILIGIVIGALLRVNISQLQLI